MTVPRAERYDVVVIGGGAGGVAAAIGAARTGARTLLVERYGFLGGAATNAQVLSYCGFFTSADPPLRTVAGVGGELLAELNGLGFDTAPVRSKSGNWIVMIDLEAVKFALDRLVLASGVQLSLHTWMVEAHRADARVESVTIADHRGMRDVAATAFVDASGEATLATLARVPLSQPGGPDAHLQPATLPMVIDGVAPDATFDRSLMTELVRRYNASADEPMPRADGGVLMRLPASGNVWWMMVDLHTDGVSGTDLARAETSARRQAWTFMEVLRQHPGFEHAHLAATGPQLGIRETRRPRSLRDVTGDDGRVGKRHEDGIARASWPMEVHDAPGRVRFMPIGGEGFFDVPHGALCAEGVENLRLAGRVVGSDGQAYGSVRVMGTAFATGHAAGISAALHASGARSTAEDVRAALVRQGALV